MAGWSVKGMGWLAGQLKVWAGWLVSMGWLAGQLKVWDGWLVS
jgi:hypothetical protein